MSTQLQVPPRDLRADIPEWAPEALWTRIGMELGAIPPPAGTVRVQRQIIVPFRVQSMRDVQLKSRKYATVKTDLQGLYMRELHQLHGLLPRPIPSVGENGELAPILAHVRIRHAQHGERDLDNYGIAIKALGDALVGPLWRGQPTKGKPRTPANRILMVGDRAYKGGWLDRDTQAHWRWTMDFAETIGPPRIHVVFVWDQPDTLPAAA